MRCSFMMSSKNLLKLLNMANFIPANNQNVGICTALDQTPECCQADPLPLSSAASHSDLILSRWLLTKARNHRSRRRWDDRVGFLEVKVQRSRSWTWRGQLSTTLQSRTASHPASELSHMDKSQGAARSPSSLEKNTLLIITSPNSCVRLGVAVYSHKDLWLL